MKLFKNKLSSQKGETMVETLAAFLIVSLTCVMLLTSVMTAFHMNGKVKLLDKQLRKEIEYAERRVGNTEKSVLITFGHNSYSQTVYYTGDISAGELLSYEAR